MQDGLDSEMKDCCRSLFPIYPSEVNEWSNFPYGIQAAPVYLPRDESEACAFKMMDVWSRSRNEHWLQACVADRACKGQSMGVVPPVLVSDQEYL